MADEAKVEEKDNFDVGPLLDSQKFLRAKKLLRCNTPADQTWKGMMDEPNASDFSSFNAVATDFGSKLASIAQRSLTPGFRKIMLKKAVDLLQGALENIICKFARRTRQQCPHSRHHHRHTRNHRKRSWHASWALQVGVMWEDIGIDAGIALEERGVWLQDGAVSEDTAAEVRQEILKCHVGGLLTQSGNKLAVRLPDGTRGGRVCKKLHVFEADVIVDGAVNCPQVVQECPVLAALLAQEAHLRKHFSNLRPWLRIDRLEQAKVQVNTGSGGAFPCHFDLPADPKSDKRLLTVLLYLNPDWTAGDGGEVEVLPFPFENCILPPVNRRLVAFSSCTTLHRVRPFHGQSRVCLNLWFEGEAQLPFPAPLQPDLYNYDACNIVRILRQRPAELRAFCKVWYSDTMIQSLRDAFEECQEY